MSDAPLAAAPFATDFMLEVLTAASEAPFGDLAWSDINRLAARWLRPEHDEAHADTSRLGHALVLDMVRAGLLDAEVTTGRDGRPLVARVLHARYAGVEVGRQLAA
ncbi:MAG: hypothetical protein R3181_14510 [Rubricoccaceae bacterium]|nr:hypothetical protein [Rubricoccaceae bacterium]